MFPKYESRNQPIHIRLREHPNNHPARFHKHLEIMLVKYEKIKVTRDGVSYNLSPGDMYIAFPNTPHAIEADDASALVMIIDPECNPTSRDILMHSCPEHPILRSGEADVLTYNVIKRMVMFQNYSPLLARYPSRPCKYNSCGNHREDSIKTSQYRYNIAAAVPAIHTAELYTANISEHYLRTDTVQHDKANYVESDTGELWRDLKRSIGAVDSPRTKIVYGKLGRFHGEDTLRRDLLGLELQLNGMKVDCFTDYGVVALSSLTDDDISSSEHMLLTTIGRARNSSAQFDGEKMIDVGHAPLSPK